MSIVKTGSARYQPLGKEGKGHVSTGSGALSDQPYGFNTRFEDKSGTNPEELIAAAHSSCYAMALSFALSDAGYQNGDLKVDAEVTLEKDGDGFTVTKSALTLEAKVDGIDEYKFADIAKGAKENCPISKLLNAKITLDYTLQS
ncbi:OsmC family protein [Alteromonas sp. RKMC-009]|uniref:OsmC family protein n=1 Tax=Alteromonas sp. RKMC-009 TaxID=2267264 RepID=UPI000E69E6D6|nr:OsmC family protein [Alteromonas sp. RKMC-009]AYA63176.1 OsmC family peroxiredoxin [Alteromonas sp. RKMC-009]